MRFRPRRKKKKPEGVLFPATREDLALLEKRLKDLENSKRPKMSPRERLEQRLDERAKRGR